MTARDPETLPRGRHGLPRKEVVASQRSRIVRALAEAMVEKGYTATSVADVLFRARVSRETFYEQFASKSDCFMAAWEAAAERLVSRLAAEDAPETGGTMLERLDRGLGRYLEALAADPAFARLLLVEVYAAGPEAIERRHEQQRRFVDLVETLVGTRGEGDRFACEAFVAATSSMVTARLAVGDADGLAALREPLLEVARRLFAPTEPAGPGGPRP